MAEDACEIFFIVGRGRSGTTLMSRMLGRHGAIAVAPEGFFIMNLAARYGRGPWDRARIDDFCRDLLLENRMKTWGLELHDVRARLERALPGLDFPTACRLVYASYAQTTCGRDEAVRVGDKNPHYGLFVKRLARMFPAAKFVYIVRDPRDNVLSYEKVPFDVSDPGALAYRWRRYNEEILETLDARPERFVQLRYEDLLARPEEQLSRVCEALGLNYDPNMLSFHESGPEDFYGKDSPWFRNLGKPLDSSQARKWEREMTPEAIGLIESICRPLMERFGYEASSVAGRPGWTARARALYGWGTVAAEKAIFGMVPAELRMWVINTYRSRSGRV